MSRRSSATSVPCRRYGYHPAKKNVYTSATRKQSSKGEDLQCQWFIWVVLAIDLLLFLWVKVKVVVNAKVISYPCCRREKYPWATLGMGGSSSSTKKRLGGKAVETFRNRTVLSVSVAPTEGRRATAIDIPRVAALDRTYESNWFSMSLSTLEPCACTVPTSRLADRLTPSVVTVDKGCEITLVVSENWTMPCLVFTPERLWQFLDARPFSRGYFLLATSHQKKIA